MLVNIILGVVFIGVIFAFFAGKLKSESNVPCSYCNSGSDDCSFCDY